ncbi:hypothetical protein HanHA300_Chr15g0562431 [Helianthus annuus]|nr:hypothetical protein HanHA300_Chr15g0562431 [Helianthus annuus]KAJ0472840.1 hypothetical protein HanHA89_Chr15g0611631 [Helianthus annuus]KAJ0648448.1 hypothetical protein HanLR1_Chr15g0573051 [Helianthus annuus]KAJ0652276.1 hypothetical protein HanOQP8_Chr15g0570381 [Helianthus annuus]
MPRGRTRDMHPYDLFFFMKLGLHAKYLAITTDQLLLQGDETKARFWVDNWIEGGPLWQRFPDLFRLTQYNSAWISDNRVFMDRGSIV